MRSVLATVEAAAPITHQYRRGSPCPSTPRNPETSNVKQTFDLAPLAADYDIIGELDDAAGGRTYIATRKGEERKRRDDQTGVLITVVTTPEGDEANALSHLAADTKLLAGTAHRRLVPVIEGRWLGDDAFAVVTQRSTDPSLAQRLASGETFTNTRIAAILREVNGLLEWAREQKIVHRSIPAARVFLEPKTDRVRVTFAIAPILRLHRADDRDDARTIARLASAMLTGDVDPRAHEGQTLAELRPDLPERLGEATAALLDEKRTDVAPDVAAYLALIGMADPVAAGEAERERIRAEILEEQRAEREKLADERASFERTMAEERASFERTMTEERAKLEAERSALQERATAERDALQRAVADERAQLVAKRAELERVVAGQRAELERRPPPTGRASRRCGKSSARPASARSRRSARPRSRTSWTARTCWTSGRSPRRRSCRRCSRPSRPSSSARIPRSCARTRSCSLRSPSSRPLPASARWRRRWAPARDRIGGDGSCPARRRRSCCSPASARRCSRAAGRRPRARLARRPR